MTTSLHQARLDLVIETLRAHAARGVLDLGCGTGPLLEVLAQDNFFDNIVGLDTSRQALEDSTRLLERAGVKIGGRIRLMNASFTDADPNLAGFDAAVLLETIEHIPPDRLSQVERAIFNSFRPGLVIITTPNQECNELLGVPSHRLRHPEHEFEWSRAKFEAWAGGVGTRNGYRTTFQGIGWSHPTLGAASQMAIFVRAEA
ncbi:MAG: methyltransferase domain-containing protein [Rhodospirillaceae bacterium]|jgi:3' terminal RNA ribose 2'-O-methyltransferase Hen1|nr:methyltransferase domain-containing protein [Rhodospirillaceae bacterium]MBT4043266.1 methyltransferase domain-containing protein [Rhodospirillaceae bacterium]MBT4688986.1 methyltransferase domain-containing protein [Rhodospirillaceae bacterium]MBT5083661.1 methyltransferase domain-containing protein [Rhodospirillaceae bacterium]MBT5522537.1 methyltransferase domain-containing protein [Rhodospirillaceae bacterium]